MDWTILSITDCWKFNECICGFDIVYWKWWVCIFGVFGISGCSTYVVSVLDEVEWSKNILELLFYLIVLLFEA